MLLGLTQEQLAKSVGMVQQQLQLYERGASRVTASRLYAFSRALCVPVEFFFEGLRTATGTASHTDAPGPHKERAEAADLLPLSKNGRTQQDVLAVLRAYRRIEDPKDRKAALDLLKRLGSKDT